MDKKTQAYETIFVTDITKGEENVKAVIEKFTSLIAANGEITQICEWGKRRLAYPINYKTEGNYTLVYFTAPTDFASELERLYNINENILRSIVVKLDEKVKQTAVNEAPVVAGDDDDEEATEAPKAQEKAAEEPAAEEAAETEEASEATEEVAEEVVEEAVEEAAEAVEEATEAEAEPEAEEAETTEEPAAEEAAEDA